jgi:ABC-type branched-subunit amino acid transport system substrate-binding protein
VAQPQPVTAAPAPAPEAAPPANAAQLRIALLVPLTGPNARLGHALLDAAEMALFDAANEQLVLLPHDTKGTAEGAAAAANTAIGEGVQLILGPLLAAEVEAVKPVAQKANVNVVAFSTSEQLAGGGTFLLSVLPRQSVDRVVAYAHAQGISRFAALAPSTPYGQLIVDVLRSAATANSGSVDPVQFYDPSASDLRPSVRAFAGFDERKAALDREKNQLAAAGDDASQQALQHLDSAETLGDAGFGAVMLPDGGGKLKAVASLLPYYDVDPAKVRFLGTGLWDDPSLGSEPSLVGGWFAAPDPAARADFERRYQELYKLAPPRLATLGYDAAALAAVLAKRPRETAFTAASLCDPSGFAGVDGIFRFHPDGRIERGLAVLEITRDGPKVISPAPQSFEPSAS